MSVRTSSVKSVKDRNRSVTYEGIEDEIKRATHTRRAAGTTRSFVRGLARRAR